MEREGQDAMNLSGPCPKGIRGTGPDGIDVGTGNGRVRGEPARDMPEGNSGAKPAWAGLEGIRGLGPREIWVGTGRGQVGWSVPRPGPDGIRGPGPAEFAAGTGSGRVGECAGARPKGDRNGDGVRGDRQSPGWAERTGPDAKEA